MLATSCIGKETIIWMKENTYQREIALLMQVKKAHRFAIVLTTFFVTDNGVNFIKQTSTANIRRSINYESTEVYSGCSQQES